MKRLAALLVLILSTQASAQQTHDLWVKTIDVDGNAIGQATVKLYLDQILEVEGLTNDQGTVMFQVERVPPGRPTPVVSATAEAQGYQSVNQWPLPYPTEDMLEADAHEITLPAQGQPRPVIGPGDLRRSPFTSRVVPVPLDKGLWDLTRAAGWTHTANTGGVWFRRCGIGPASYEGMPAGWGLNAGTSVAGVFTTVGCTFTLFGGRQLNEGFEFVGVTVVTGNSAGLCAPGSTVTEVSALAPGPATLPTIITTTGPEFEECLSVVTEILIRVPAGGVALNAFIP